MKVRSFMLVVCAAAFAVSCQSKQPEPAAAAPPQPPYSTTATVKDIMLHIVDPAGDMVWNATSTVIDKGGLHETIPKTDEEWFKVRSGLIMLIEGSNMLMIPGRHVAKAGEKSETPGIELEPSEMEDLINKDRAAWYARAKKLHDTATMVLELVEKRDAQKLFEAGEDIDSACENCHKQYWYPNEKIPDFPASTK
jgi:cytochrome c556